MISAIFTLLLYVIALGLLVWLVHYAVDNLPVVQPFGRWAKVIAVILAVMVLIVLLLDLAGGGNIGLPRLR
jgi:hypothetical protein